jgi:hypothetical protein
MFLLYYITIILNTAINIIGAMHYYYSDETIKILCLTISIVEVKFDVCLLTKKKEKGLQRKY